MSLMSGNRDQLVQQLRNEATSRRAAGDLAGASRALQRAREADPDDPTTTHEYANSIVERLQAGENVPAQERTLGCEAFLTLAETYGGDHGLAYSGAALDIDPGHDRALQLNVQYARTLGREEDVGVRCLAYVQANPNTALAAEARWLLEASYEAAGQIENAIQILEPLRAIGDANAVAKARELYARMGRPLSAPPPHAAPATQSVRPAPPSGLEAMLDAARALATSSTKKPQAFAKYKEVLEADPAHPEALSWVEEYLRAKRDYRALRDVLVAAARVADRSSESSKELLREIAGLCDSNLRDVDGAIQAYRQLLAMDRSDEAARQALTRLLEKSQRWDDLASLMEQEASSTGDLEEKIALEKKLAVVHEQKRRDPAAAAEALGRIAALTPEDDHAVITASKAFEKAGAMDKAALVIAECVASIADSAAQVPLLTRLGELREQLHDASGAGDAYTFAAEAQPSTKVWEAAERCYSAAERWDRASHAAEGLANATHDAKQQAQHVARAAGYLVRIGDEERVVQLLEHAVELDPTSDECAQPLVERYTSGGRHAELALLFVKRADRLGDKAARVAMRRQASSLYKTQLADLDSAREQWLKILEDGDDKDALEELIQQAIDRTDFGEAAELLHRLCNATAGNEGKTRVALREAELLAKGVGDVDAAIERYESIVTSLDPKCRGALESIAQLQEARDNHAAAAEALERELKLTSEAPERGRIAGWLARLYDKLDDATSAIRALDIVRGVDADDFDALARLCDLCEQTEQWARVAELLAARIEVEADDAESASMALKLSEILADRLSRGDEALAALTELGDAGIPEIREAYIDLGDRLGWKGIVATKMVEWWFEAKPNPDRTTRLRGAFERFSEVGRDTDAVRVAVEIVRSRGADPELADRLEDLSIKTKDLDALAIAHDLKARDLKGADRAQEFVRQAEVSVKAGAPYLDAIGHGEAGLTSIPPTEAEELLARLAALAEKPSDVVDLYERQISRCKAPADRTRVLARAAQVAADRDLIDRARGFFDIALSSTPSDESLSMLETAAREADEKAGGEKLRRTLCAAMAACAPDPRDGGRMRGTLLRRAAAIAHGDFSDVEQALTWLGDALIANVDPATLDALEELGSAVGEPRRAEAVLTRVLSEVLDGPPVRPLLARRAKIRRVALNDKTGAAADLKKLHDLSPTDQAVTEELSELLTELADYRALVVLYDEQIVRGKDMEARAELARKVARMWAEHLADPREAADAWRRVLRMKPGDPEATTGLESAKVNMLSKPPPADPGDSHITVS